MNQNETNMTQKTKLIITAAQYERMQIPGIPERRDIPGTTYENWPDAGIFATHFGEDVLIEFDPNEATEVVRLKQAWEAVKHLELDAFDKMKAQRDELLAALEFCRSVIHSQGMYDMSEKMAVVEADKAIAKITNQKAQ